MADDNEDLDLLWGIEAISKVIGRGYQQTSYMLRTGKLPAQRVGERWVASRKKIVEFFMGEAA